MIMPKGTPKNPNANFKRGFASMDPERQREIASEGGKKAHQLGRAHRFTPEEGKLAAQKSVEARANRLLAKTEKAERLLGVPPVPAKPVITGGEEQ
jgi:general stress protein YciG